MEENNKFYEEAILETTSFIEGITKATIKVMETSEIYEVSIGNKNPIRVNYEYKNHKSLTKEEIRYAAFMSLAGKILLFLKRPAEFKEWIESGHNINTELLRHLTFARL